MFNSMREENCKKLNLEIYQVILIIICDVQTCMMKINGRNNKKIKLQFVSNVNQNNSDNVRSVNILLQKLSAHLFRIYIL